MDSSFKSFNDQLLEDCKSLPGQSGSLPFPSWGAGWGAAQIFRSEAHWDAYTDSLLGIGADRSIEKYLQQIGDPADNSLYMAAVRFLGDSIPEAPLQVKRKADVDGDGQKGESVVVPDHPLAKLWQRPNDAYPGITLKKGIAYSLVTSNNAYVIKFFNNVGFPLELWWEPHWTIRPVWPIDGSSFIAYYEVNRGGMWYPIPVNQVIHIRDGINPYNQRLGLDGNRSIAREVAGDNASADYYANLMSGSGVPTFAVSIDKERQMDPATMEAFDRRIQEKTRGSKKGQPLILHGARPYKLGNNPKEMDLRETRYMAEDRFCGVKGIPAVVLELGTGIAHSIYKNVSEAQKRAWRNYVCPKLSLIEETLNIQLLEDFEGRDSGLYCMHDLTAVEALQEESDSREKRLSNMYTNGGIMRLEYRSGMGYGPSDPKNPDADRVWGKMSAQESAQREDIRAQRDIEKTKILANSRQKFNPGEDMSFGGKVKPPRGNQKKQPLKSIKSDSTVTWVDFPDWMGSLNIPRIHMPQVLSSHRGAMVQFLKGRGISSTKEDVLPHTLRPSQKEYSPEKVAKAKEWTGPQRPLLVSENGYVADGHHQWAAALDNPESTIPIFRLGAEIVELLLEIARFPSSGVKDENDQEIFWNGMSRKAIPGMRAEFSYILPNCEVALDGMDMLLALLATDRILTFASEFTGPAALLKKVEMLPSDRPGNLAYVQGPYEDGGFRMVFNSDLWTDQEVMKQALAETIGTDDVSTIPVDTVESTIDHELAHILAAWVRANSNGSGVKGDADEVWSTEDALNMTRYSIAGPKEAFAEAFAIRQLFGIDKVPAGEIRQSLQDTINFANQSTTNSL